MPPTPPSRNPQKGAPARGDGEARDQEVRDQVRAAYGGIAAKGGGSCCGPSGSSCCGPGAGGAADRLAGEIGYAPGELAVLPDGANLGLSCGNPTALASLREGETVLDLGSGGGIDVFLAAERVGPRGRAIGVDMTPEMVALARRNAAAWRQETGGANVEFRLGEIEHLPVSDASVDVVISNCVLNLVPDKAQAWREIARVLRPGGRVAVSDLALLRPLPAAVRASAEALVGCVAGAVTVEEYERAVAEAGLVEVEVVRRPDYVRALAATDSESTRRIAALLPAGDGLADYVTSLSVLARTRDHPAKAPRDAKGHEGA